MNNIEHMQSSYILSRKNNLRLKKKMLDVIFYENIWASCLKTIEDQKYIKYENYRPGCT